MISKFIFILITLVLVTGCAEIKENKNLTLTISWGGINTMTIDAISPDFNNELTNKDTSIYINVVVEIANPTVDTIVFSSMTCSYEDYFIMEENTVFKIQNSNDCFTNAPCSIQLPPKTKTNRYLVLKLLIPEKQLPNQLLKIGMKHNDKILWSNVLNTDQLFKHVYSF
jgi:hypothetical protein